MSRAAPAMQAVMRLDPGASRDHQEDHAGAFPEIGLALVADGMGGHRSGLPAAILTVTVVSDSLRPWADVPWEAGRPLAEHPLITAIHLANMSILEDVVRDRGRKGQGSTVAAVQRVGDSVVIAHVGDSRVYRFRRGALEQFTADHSLLNEYIELKRLTPQEIKDFPYKNVITRALGMSDSVKVDARLERLAPGDLFLVCSDGLTRALTDEEIATILTRVDWLEATGDHLIGEAKRRGAEDNLSLVLVRWPEAEPA